MGERKVPIAPPSLQDKPIPPPAPPKKAHCAVYRQLAIELDTSALRHELFDERDHVVVPAIPIVGDIVLRAGGSAGPEFVPAEELAKAPAAWNGRPVLTDHPPNGLANEPRTLESMSFGYLFNSRFADGKLKTEVWADVEKVDKLGSDFITNAEAGIVMENSVGVFMTLQDAPGVRNGQSYVGIWRDIVPEHLAVLPPGVKGACGIADGCGANRLAKDQRQMNLTNFVSRVRQLQDAGTSDNDLHMMLSTALRAVVPGFDWIEDVFQESLTVIYSVFLESGFTFWRHNFTFDDGTVELVGEPEQVEPSTTFQTLTDKPFLPTDDNDISVSSTDQGEPMSTDKRKAGLVQGLIDCPCTAFAEEHRAALETLEVDALEKLQPPPDVPAPADAADDEPEVVAAAPVAPAAIPDGHVLLTTEDHAAMKESSDAFHAQQAEVKSDLVANLSAGQTTFDKDELSAMPVATLRKLAEMHTELSPDSGAVFAGTAPAVRDAASVAKAPRPYDIALGKTEGVPN